MTDNTVCVFNSAQYGKLLNALFTDAGGEESDNTISCAFNEISSRIPSNLQLSDDITVPTYISEEQQRNITSIFDKFTKNLGLPPSTEFSNKMKDLTMRILNSDPSSDISVTSPRVEELKGGAKENKSNKPQPKTPDTKPEPTPQESTQYENMSPLSLEDTWNLTLTLVTPFASGYCLYKINQYVGDKVGTVMYVILDSKSRELFPEGRLEGVVKSSITYTGKKALDFLSYIGYGAGNVALKGISVVDEEYGEEISSFNSFVKNAITLALLVGGVFWLYHSIRTTVNDIVNVTNNVVVIPKFLWSIMLNSATSLYNKTFLWQITSHVSKAFALFPALDGQCGIGAEGLEIYAGESGLLGIIGKAASAVNTITVLDNTQCYLGFAASKYENYKMFRKRYEPPLYIIQWAVLHLTGKDIFYYPNVVLDKLPLVSRIDGVRKRIIQTPEELKEEHSMAMTKQKSDYLGEISSRDDTIYKLQKQLADRDYEISTRDRNESLRSRSKIGGKSRRRKAKKAKRKTRKHHKRKTRKSGKKKAKKRTNKKR